MTAAEPVAEPAVQLLDARERVLDEPGLRAWARTETAACGEPYVSRSYRFPFALIASYSQPVGVDLERVEPYDGGFHKSICTPSERGAWLDDWQPDEFVSSLWCSKEALSKALGDAVAYDPRRLGSPLFWPDGRAGAWQARRLPAPAAHCAWLCWRASHGRDG